jgi:hypothetical protein
MNTLAETSEAPLAHAYAVHVNPTDFELLAPAIKPLLSELRQAVVHHAKYEHYTLGGEVAVTVVSDESVARGKCTVVASSPAAVEHRVPSETPDTHFVLILPDGTKVPLVDDLVTIGRSSACTIVISDSNVSRTHAELRVTDAGWQIEDRGSTNGTTIDGEMITSKFPLRGGEVIAFGALLVRFEKA